MASQKKKDNKAKPNKKNQPDKEQVIFVVSLTRERKMVISDKITGRRKIATKHKRAIGR